MTYEDGFQWLQGPNLHQYIHQIAELMQLEHDPEMRSKFVELVGYADLFEYIPVLVEQLSHDSRDVRFWAYNQLSLSEHEIAKAHAARYMQNHPEEDFY